MRLHKGAKLVTVNNQALLLIRSQPPDYHFDFLAYHHFLSFDIRQLGSDADSLLQFDERDECSHSIIEPACWLKDASQ